MSGNLSASLQFVPDEVCLISQRLSLHLHSALGKRNKIQNFLYIFILQASWGHIEGTLGTPPVITEYYRIEGFKGGPELAPLDAERCQSPGQPLWIPPVRWSHKLPHEPNFDSRNAVSILARQHTLMMIHNINVLNTQTTYTDDDT